MSYENGDDKTMEQRSPHGSDYSRSPSMEADSYHSPTRVSKGEDSRMNGANDEDEYEGGDHQSYSGSRPDKHEYGDKERGGREVKTLSESPPRGRSYSKPRRNEAPTDERVVETHRGDRGAKRDRRSNSRESRGRSASRHGANSRERAKYRSSSRGRSAPYHRNGGTYSDMRETEQMPISDEDASFILGIGGRTKRKLARVCGAELNVTESGGRTILEMKGTTESREKARLYVGFVMQQRVGPVTLNCTPSDRDDLTVMEIPHECVGYVTGRKGQGLRSVEEEWCTLMFFTDLRSSAPGETERLAIFGTERARRGAQLKVMSAVEQKMRGYFSRSEINDFQSEKEGFDTDTMPIKEEDYSYALGREGSTRKKLARAAGAILEYVGRTAYIAGTYSQRFRARQYLQWLCAQRTSYVHVDASGRDDCTVIKVPTECVAYVTGTKGNSLRRIEEATSTFIFLDGDRGNSSERLLIFGENEAARRRAKHMVDERIDDKLSGRSNFMGRNRDRFDRFNDRNDRYDGNDRNGRYGRNDRRDWYGNGTAGRHRDTRDTRRNSRSRSRGGKYDKHERSVSRARGGKYGRKSPSYSRSIDKHGGGSKSYRDRSSGRHGRYCR